MQDKTITVQQLFLGCFIF